MKRSIALLLAGLTLSLFGCTSAADTSVTAAETTVSSSETSAAAAADDQVDAYAETTEDTTADIAAEDDEIPTELIPIVFSIEGGFVTEATELVLSLPDNAPDGAYIRYTTDCSEPGISSKIYSSPITVGAGEATVVRAAAYSRGGRQISHIETNTYIKAAPDRFNTLVFSLVSNDRNLNGANGIISNPTESGKDWERPCHVEVFEENGTRVISQDAGIRIFGGSSRILPQKSFRLVARKDGYYDELLYNGKGSFEYPFFEGRTVIAGEDAGQPLTKFDRLILRNGGNDSLQATAADPTYMTLTRDAVAKNSLNNLPKTTKM